MTVNQNPLSNSQYQATLVKFPDLKYMGQSVNLPGVTLTPVDVFPHDVDYTLHPERILYEPVSFNFVVDDTLSNYTQLYQWMLDIVAKDDAHLTEFTELVILLYNRQFTPVKRITFKDCFCAGLSGMQLSTVDTESVLVCDATFDYSSYSIENV